MNPGTYLRLLVTVSITILMSACSNSTKQAKPAMIPEVNVVKQARELCRICRICWPDFCAADIKIFPPVPKDW